MSDGPPFVSVVVISKDRHDELEKAVATLLALDYPKERYEVIVVEEGDAPTPLDGVRYVHLPRRDLGLGYARNTGVSHTRGQIVAFTDDDCLVDPAWLRQIVATFDDPGVDGVAGATFAQPAGLIGMCEDLLGFPGGGHRRYHEYGGRPGPTKYLSGCNCAYRREVFDTISFKEDSYGRLGGDDELLGATVAAAGKCLYAPAAVVYHKPRNSLRRIVTWFGRRRINDLLYEEAGNGRKDYKFLWRAPQRVMLYRAVLPLALIALFGWRGAAAVVAGAAAWYVYIAARCVPLARYFPTRKVIFVAPVVRLFMDVGVLVAEWRYLTQSHAKLGLALREYRR